MGEKYGPSLNWHSQQVDIQYVTQVVLGRHCSHLRSWSGPRGAEYKHPHHSIRTFFSPDKLAAMMMSPSHPVEKIALPIGWMA